MFNRKPVLNIIDESTYEELSKPCQKLVVKAEKGDFKSLVSVAKGFIYEKDNFPQNINLGLSYLQFGAEKSNAESLKLYGRYLLQGEIINQDETQAIEFLNEYATKTKNATVKIELAEILLTNQSFDINSTANSNINYPLVKQIYKDAADYGNIKGMTKYALFCQKKKSNRFGEIEPDFAEASKYFKTAAERGDSDAMIEYGKLLSQGIPTIPYDYSSAKKWFKKSYESGNLDAYAEYGYSLTSDNYGPTDEPEAFRLIKYSSDHGSSNGDLIYGIIYSAGLCCVQVDNEKAYELIKRAALAGSPRACTTLGIIYENGYYVEQNGYTAAKWYKLGLEEGSYTSPSNLGSIYKTGCNGMPSDSIESRNYYKYGADLGVRECIYQYCLNLYTGDQRLKYIYEIRKYLEIGRQLKHAPCVLLLGNMYISGDLFPTNKELGSMFVKEAAELGNTAAMERFVDMYENGADGFSGNPPELQKYKNILANNQSKCCLLI